MTADVGCDGGRYEQMGTRPGLNSLFHFSLLFCFLLFPSSYFLKSFVYESNLSFSVYRAILWCYSGSFAHLPRAVWFFVCCLGSKLRRHLSLPCPPLLFYPDMFVPKAQHCALGHFGLPESGCTPQLESAHSRGSACSLCTHEETPENVLTLW